MTATPDTTGPPPDPAAAAAYWIARQQLALLDVREEAAFQAWLAVAQNASAFESVQKAVDAAGALAGHPDIGAMRDAALAMTPAPRSPGWAQWGRWMGVAASLAALALAVNALWLMRVNRLEPPVSAVMQST
jgi:ferric-dicitrate binding protein FerR (iron transport regulator)